MTITMICLSIMLGWLIGAFLLVQEAKKEMTTHGQMVDIVEAWWMLILTPLAPILIIPVIILIIVAVIIYREEG